MHLEKTRGVSARKLGEHLVVGKWSTVSSSGLPSSRQIRSYWRESSGGLRG